MNKNEAKKLAENVTISELREMLLNARNSIQDWSKVSRVNKGMTIGVSFNIFSYGFEDGKMPSKINPITKKNMIWEFGEYLPNYTKPTKSVKSEVKVVHQEPRDI